MLLIVENYCNFNTFKNKKIYIIMDLIRKIINSPLVPKLPGAYKYY